VQNFNNLYSLTFFDTELFIAEVEKEKCPWKMNSKEYIVDRYFKVKAWAKIASNMYDEWESYNKMDKNLRVNLKFLFIHFFYFL